MKALLEAAGDGLIDEVAPSPIERWEPGAGLSGAPGAAFDAVYDKVLSATRDVGWRLYDFRLALSYCRREGVEEVDSTLRSPLGGSPRQVVGALLMLDESRAERVLKAPRRARRGGLLKEYDPRWRLVDIGSTVPAPPSFSSREGLMSRLNYTAFNESAATEVAALNLLEYDGMPWRFYLDMARQCEDESRHSLLAAERLEQLGGRIGQFPVSYFGNFYHMFWEMTLVERLIAMNVDTEAVGQVVLGEIGKKLEERGDKESALVYEYLESDERRHARFGGRWMKFLYPDPARRRAAVEACRAMTMVNLASEFAQLTGFDVREAIDYWLAFGGPSVTSEPLDARERLSVSLLTARRGGSNLGDARARVEAAVGDQTGLSSAPVR
ncbi:MAG TPA: DUF455 family protein [Nitrososphaerales archaeon]|nr:DUF455 family protein [Nitrososphaerales archaeon]